jgi:hypothetical protein
VRFFQILSNRLIRHKTPAKRPRRRLDLTWHRRFDLPQPWIQPGAFYSLGFNLAPPRCGFDRQPEIVSKRLICHKTPAKMVKMLHKITALCTVHCIEILNEIWREKKPNCASRGSRFAPNFIQNLYTVLKKRLWESRSTPILVRHRNSI